MKLQWAMKLPEAWRLLRICWRPKRLATVAVLSIVVSLLITAGFMMETFMHNLEQNQFHEELLKVCDGSMPDNGIISKKAALEFCKNPTPPKPYKYPYSDVFIMMMLIQGALYLVAGTFITGASIYSEFDKDTWVLQQTTSQSPRKLLLGKMLGAPGDIFVVSACNMPFLVGSAVLAQISFIAIAKTFLTVFLLSATVYSFVLLLLVVQGKTKSTPTSLIIGGLLLVLAIGLAEGSMVSFRRSTCDNSLIPISGLNPGCVINNIYDEDVSGGDKQRSSKHDDNGAIYLSRPTVPEYDEHHQPMTDFRFFGFNLDGYIFAMSVYLVFALWMFMAAESELRRRMSIRSYRLYLPAWFLIIEFLYVGFSRQFAGTDDYVIAAVINSMMLASMLYFVIFTQMRDKGELRPWIYRTAVSKPPALEYFASDAPPVYTIVACLLIALCGVVANAEAAHGRFNVVFAYQFSTLAVIVLRDSFIFQIAKMTGKRGPLIAVVLYVIVFCAIPGLVSIMIQKLNFDLTPISAIASSALAGNVYIDLVADNKAVLYSYIPINGALAVIFFCIHSFMIKKTRRGLDAPKAPAGR